LKQLHEELRELGFEGSYDRVAAFARVWRAGQTDRVNSASKRTTGEFKGIQQPYDVLSSATLVVTAVENFD
jgi:endo-alpha-1,4-polygalactosaminidase (GH114 family)